MQRSLFGVTAMTLLSYGGEYMAFTSILVVLFNLLVKSGMPALEAYGFGLLVSSVYLLISGVLAVPFGSLSDKFGRRNLAVVGCTAAGVGILAVPASAALTTTGSVILGMALILSLVGIGHATYTTSALAYAGDISTEKDVGEVYGLVETAEYTMFMFGTPLGAILAQQYGLQITFYLPGGILILGALAAFVGMPERRGLVPSTLSDEVDPKTISMEGGNKIRLLLAAVKDRGVLAALFSIFFVSVGFTVFRLVLTPYGTNGQPGIISGPLLITLMAVASVVSAVPIGYFIDSSKKRTPFMIAGFLGSAAALALIFVAPSPLSLVAWSAVFGVAIMLVRVPQAVVVAERTVLENRAGAMGANHAVEHVGYGAGAFLGGLLLTSYSLSLSDTFLVFGLILLAFGFLLLPLGRLMGLR